MSDVRALLKAKRQETRVNHPLASYTLNGQLRCLACGTVVKQSSSWEGHVGSKTHRMNVVRLRQEEDRARSEERKRKAVEAEGDESDEEGGTALVKKQKTGPEPLIPGAATTAAPTPGGFPVDFFSDPSQAPTPPSSGDDGEEEINTTDPFSQQSAPASAIDLEWEKFQQTVINASDAQETYERATVAAEPVLAPEDPGFLPLNESGSREEPAEQLSEEQLRFRKEQEERELIMDRLLDEERVQEEADAKVTILKNRLEKLKRQRELKKAQKAKGINS